MSAIGPCEVKKCNKSENMEERELIGLAWLLILAFTFSSSIDNLGVGVSYGIRNIRISHFKNLLIAVICFLFSMVGILFGRWIATVLPGILPVLLGSFLIFVIGLRIILLAVPRKKEVSGAAANRPIGAHGHSMKGILKHPENVDVDQSGQIGFVEACVLGVALSANALTNGLGAGLLGLSPLAISLTASIGSYLTVWWGVALGHKMTHIRIGSFSVGQFGTLISGAILLLIAFTAFF